MTPLVEVVGLTKHYGSKRGVIDLTAARNAWVAAHEEELLPIGYVHIVFTLPEPLARLALVNKRVVYDLLFQAAAATLLQDARNPKRLGGAIGGLMVLHTWAAAAAPSPRPLRRAGGQIVAGWHLMDPRAAAFLPPIPVRDPAPE